MIDWWGDPTAVTSVGRRHGFRDAGAAAASWIAPPNVFSGAGRGAAPTLERAAPRTTVQAGAVAVALLLGAELVSEHPA